MLASSYELVLADLRQTPVAGAWLLRLHALVSLAYFTLGIAAIRQWLPGGRRWCWAAVFAVPVVFHQLAFVKNDLYSATPALVALVWLTARAGAAPHREIAAVSALAGFAVAMKWVAFPLGLLMAGTIAWQRSRDAGAWLALALGGTAGAVAGGLPFTLAQTDALVRAPVRAAGRARQPHHRRRPRARERGALRHQPVRLRMAHAAVVAGSRRLGRDVRRSPAVGDGHGRRALEQSGRAARRGAGRDLRGGVRRDLPGCRPRTPPGAGARTAAHRRRGGSTATATTPTAIWLRRALAAALVVSSAQIARSLWLYLGL